MLSVAICVEIGNLHCKFQLQINLIKENNWLLKVIIYLSIPFTIRHRWMFFVIKTSLKCSHEYFDYCK